MYQPQNFKESCFWPLKKYFDSLDFCENIAVLTLIEGNQIKNSFFYINWLEKWKNEDYIMKQRRKLRWNRFKSGCGSVWLERCVRDAEAGGSNPLTPTIFLPWFQGKKTWSRQASLHAPQVRFIYFDAWRAKLASTKCASYGEAVLHKSLTMKHCSAKAPQYEAASFHSAMKHSLRSYDEKMKNESLSVCNTTLSALYYDLQSSPLWLDFFYVLILPNEGQPLIA